jgi:tetratricopeptide (TPR) repeat protein
MRLAKHAYDYQEFVLAHDPKRVEAGLVIGIYRYLVSTLTLPMRFMAYVAGFGGGKEKGIALIEGASRAFDTHVDAKVSLLLIYNREGRFADAIRVARELEEEFPRNRLLTMEQGSSEIRASRAADAEATLSRGLAAFDKDDRPKIPGERATWLYKRGVARIMLRRTAEARADLEAAEKNQPADWVKGRLQIELGRVADLSGKRTEALAAYRQARDLCIARNDAVCTAQADTLMKQPFR